MLYRNGNAGYVSYSEDTSDVSPMYVVATAAGRLIREGAEVVLPHGYSADVLDRIAWLTGRHGERVKVDFRQANELAQIARTLQNSHTAEATPREEKAVAELLTIVTD